ncbi:MAG: hypothetical protein AB2L17_18985 [Lentimicrobium sp.]
METTGHHTCSKRIGRSYILDHAPFFAGFNEKTHRLQFLGAGYYFWDDNIEMGTKWGEDHYNNEYCILECKLNMPGDIFLDLVGNRSHMRYFRNVAVKYAESGYAREKWSLGSFIEHLKMLEKDRPGIFPFKVIRAVDLLPRDEQSKWYFVSGKRNYTLLDPRIVICITEKNALILQSKNIVYESQ